MPKPLSLVWFYNDFGRPYLPLIERATRTAKAIMPSCKTVLMTMTPSQKLFRLFDEPIVIDLKPDLMRVCFDKARAIMTYQARMTEPCVFCDPDIEFVRPIEFPDADIGLMWRPTKPAQPVNSGMVFAKPGNEEFWKQYGNTVAMLPHVLHAWWADQLAFSVMIGAAGRKAGDRIKVHDADVLLLDENNVCSAPERATQKTFALHYKGWRKGDEFEPYFPKKKAAA